MKILTPLSIGYMGASLSRNKLPSHIVTGILGFDLVVGGSFMLDTDLRTLIDDAVGSAGFWDIWMPKVRGEYLVWGSALSNMPVSGMEISVRCGSLKKQLSVVGVSQWQPSLLGWSPSVPLPFESMSVNWHSSYGGADFLANRDGVGFGSESKVAKGEAAYLPSLRYPSEIKFGLSQKIRPACFQPIDPRWNPGESGGSFGGGWLQETFPAMPSDFDWNYYNRAPLDQRLAKGFWRGDEDIVIEGMNLKFPKLVSSLPGVAMRCFSTNASDALLQEHPMVLDTVGLLPSAGKGFLIFRAELAEAGIDASNLASVMLGAEWVDRPKALVHYQNVFDLRMDAEIGSDHAGAESDFQLMPEESSEEAKAAESMRLAEFAMAAAQVQQRATARRAAAAAGVGAGLVFAAPIAAAVPSPAVTNLEAAKGLQSQASEDGLVWDSQARALLNPLNIESVKPDFVGNVAVVPSSILDTTNKSEAEDLINAEDIATSDFSTPKDQATTPKVEALNPKPEPSMATMGSQITGLADELENSSAPLADVLKKWSQSYFIGEDSEVDSLSDFESLMSAGDGVADRAELSNQLRVAAQAMENGAATLDEFNNSSDLVETALGKLPTHMQGPMRGVLEKMIGSGSTDEIENGLLSQFSSLSGGVGGTSSGILQLLSNLDPDGQSSFAGLFDSLGDTSHSENLKQLIQSQGKDGMSAEMLTLENAKGLAAWLLGRSDAVNPLITTFTESLGSDGTGTLETVLRPFGKSAHNPALNKWAEELLQSANEAESDDADVVASIEKTLAESLQAGDFSLDQLLKMINEPKAAQGAAEAAMSVEDQPDGLELDAGADQVAQVVDSEVSPAKSPEVPQAAVGEGIASRFEQLAQMQSKIDDLAPGAEPVLSGSPQGAGSGAAFTAAAAMASKSLLSAPFLAKMERLRARGEELTLQTRRLGFAGASMPVESTPQEQAARVEKVRQARASGWAMTGQDFSGLDLSGVDLHDMDLQGSCFEGTNLSHADLSGANCSKAFFAGANLSHANARGGQFVSANMRGVIALSVQLQGADLSDSLLSFALFSDANLEGANLDRCEAQSTGFERANLNLSRCEGGDFMEVDLRGATLNEAKWNKCQLIESRLDGLSAKFAHLVECIFSSAQGPGVDFSSANLERSNLLRAKLPYLYAPDAQAPETSWVECDLLGAVFVRAVLTSAIFVESSLVRADLSCTHSRGALFTAADLTEADFSKAQLLDCSLRRAKASGANFSYANLEGAELTGAELDRSDLTGALTVATLLEKPTHV